MGFFELVEKFGPEIGMLMFSIVALYYDMVVSGRRYREVCRQRDKLLNLALSGQHKAFEAVDVAKAITQPARDEADAGT